MTDTFGRSITYLRISVTDLCNLRCTYCMPAEGIAKRAHSDILRVEEILEIAGVAIELGINKVRITGGEPLLRQGLLDICRGISGFGADDLALTTNGILLERFAEPLKNAGLNRVNISLDSLNHETFRTLTRGGNLNAVLRGIKAAMEVGLAPIKLNCVLMRGVNDGEIEKLADYAAGIGAELRFIELMPIGEAAEIWRERYMSIDESAGRYKVIDPVSHTFCPTCSRLRLTADGNIKPCLHSRREFQVRGLHGTELRNALLEAVNAKPAAHAGLTDAAPSQSLRPMDRIGG